MHQVPAGRTPHRIQWSAQKPQMCAPHLAERGSQVSVRSLSRGRTAEWSARSARKGAETATHTPPRLVRKTRCGEKLGMGKERGKDESRTSGCQALTTERGLRSGAALVPGPLWAACVVWSPSLGAPRTLWLSPGAPRTPQLPGFPPSRRLRRGRAGH